MLFQCAVTFPNNFVIISWWRLYLNFYRGQQLYFDRAIELIDISLVATLILN